MTEEIKQVRTDWYEKGTSYYDIYYIHEALLDIDHALVQCNELLGEVGLWTGYATMQNRIDKVMEDKSSLHLYIEALPEYVRTMLDQPLYEDFNKKATESISRIRLEDCEVSNTLGITEDYFIPGVGDVPPQSGTRLKPTLSFEDFFGISMGEADVDLTGTVISNGYVEEFASVFAARYEAIKAMGVFDGENVPSLQEYLTQFATQGEFYNQMDQPFLSFVSSVLDITIIKPIIESAMGEDMITGEDLSDFECDMKVVFAIIDLVTLGQAIAATKLIELGGKEALEVLGKTLLIEFTSNAAATGMAGIGEALDLPTSITILLSLGTGLGVSLEGNKLLFKNAAGDLLREVQLKDDQMRSIGEVMDNADGWSFNGGLLNGVDDGGTKKILSTMKAEEYAFNAIKGSDDADSVVLGKFDALKDEAGNYVLDANGQKISSENSYDTIAMEMDAQYFNLDNWDELSSQYSKEEIWKINERFLDIQMSSGREIYLANNPMEFIGDGSYFSQEIQYLIDNGYTFVKEGEFWHAIR